MKSALQLLSTSVITHPTLSDTAKAEICSQLLADKAITYRVECLLHLYGLGHLTQAKASPCELYRLPAVRVFDYLASPIPVHMRVVLSARANYIALEIGDHICNEQCVIVTPSHAMRIAEKHLTTVDIYLNSYLLTTLAVYSDSSVTAKAVGFNREFLLKGPNTNGL